MLFLAAIEPKTLSLLRQLQELPALADTRLVGGTALALQRGHRISVDLDIFGKWDYSEDLRGKFSSTGKVEKESGTPDGKMAFFYIDGVKVDCVSYEMYEWLEPPVETGGVRLAGVKDIAAMKVNAITNRGTRKDFVDMACLLDDYSIEDIFTWYRQKYPEANPALAMRSMSYFVDAETMPMPKMLIPFDWEEAKDRIRAAVRKLAM
ncbi:MAG: nucleotidyl transferase AbiEii/AbiGii toxin family protein [Kiritimatiellae bacterium]|nr:nucleotidyl transferase AbiEii/AbiGii toxin family protein [Kiritimatiellia bacterium]